MHAQMIAGAVAAAAVAFPFNHIIDASAADIGITASIAVGAARFATLALLAAVYIWLAKPVPLSRRYTVLLVVALYTVPDLVLTWVGASKPLAIGVTAAAWLIGLIVHVVMHMQHARYYNKSSAAASVVAKVDTAAGKGARAPALHIPQKQKQNPLVNTIGVKKPETPAVPNTGDLNKLDEYFTVNANTGIITVTPKAQSLMGMQRSDFIQDGKLQNSVQFNNISVDDLKNKLKLKEPPSNELYQSEIPARFKKVYIWKFDTSENVLSLGIVVNDEGTEPFAFFLQKNKTPLSFQKLITSIGPSAMI
jgi:hypothetical protein